MDAKQRIPLSKMIGQLRTELLQAQGEAEGSNLRFLIEDIEIELHLMTTQEGEGGVGIKFWLLDANAKGKVADVETQKVKLKLKAVKAGTEESYKIHSGPTPKPR